MKKFKYSKLAILLQTLLSLFVTLCIIRVFYFDNSKFNRDIVKVVAVFLVLLTPFIGEYLNRFVEFKDGCITFNSFRIDKKVRFCTIRCEDILSLDAVKIPLLGFYKIKVKAKNVPYAIPVTWCMRNHNKLFYELYICSRQSNPDVYVDSRLIEYFEKKGYFVC